MVWVEPEADVELDTVPLLEDEEDDALELPDKLCASACVIAFGRLALPLPFVPLPPFAPLFCVASVCWAC